MPDTDRYFHFSKDIVMPLDESVPWWKQKNLRHRTKSIIISQ